MPQDKIQICLYEDRSQQIPGLKILLLTLDRYCPSWPICLRFPGIPSSFRAWLRQFSQINLCEDHLPSSGSYNVKPSVLLDALACGAKTCLWLDTDILINGSLNFLKLLPQDRLVVAQDPWEYSNGSSHRCLSWGLTMGRPLPGPLNSAVLRVGASHKELLRAWQAILLTESYLAEQANEVELRDPQMLGDQDALSALLASQRFADLPVHRLMHGTDILQHHGAGAYTPAHRWANLLTGLPPIIHAMGSVKPWRMDHRPGFLSTPRAYYERTYLELSPYVHFARQYRSHLAENAEWLETRTLAGQLGTLTAFNRPALKGLMQAALHRSLAGR
jgi:hypothetical protein